MNVHGQLSGFIQAHRGCGFPHAKAEPTITAGYLLWWLPVRRQLRALGGASEWGQGLVALSTAGVREL